MNIENTKLTEFGSLYDSRFLADYIGRGMYEDSVIAIIELIANAWDAGAKNVKIEWPTENKKIFSITDDGHGLTKNQFSSRWTKLSYNRLSSQGPDVEIPVDNDIKAGRRAYGKNGKGRFSAFCFAVNEFYVETKSGFDHNCFSVIKSEGSQPIEYREKSLPEPSLLFNNNHGTSVFATSINPIFHSEDKMRSEIGLRFLIDPDFNVFLNNSKIVFSDIDSEKISYIKFKFKKTEATIRVIQTDKSDKTTHQHGVAWQANNRLIGNCSWNGLRNDVILDGRSIFAKKYTFIVDATLISDEILPDWTNFKNNNNVLDFYDLAKESIDDYLLDLTRESRSETKKNLIDKNRDNLSKVNMIGVSRWTSFIEQVQINCPKINEHELESVASILASLEASTSQYDLIYKLRDCSPQDLDDLNSILDDWSIQSAKAVLDEIKYRLSLVESIRDKVNRKNTLELQELQPLFEKSLWIFGPEFESIEYTSNKGMTNVLKKVFKVDTKGTSDRPDFVVLPDGTLGAYGRYGYDNDGNESGIEKVVIVELKKPTISLGDTEKGQCWKYARQLYEAGVILPDAKIECYLLGSAIQKHESGIRTEKDGKVNIKPMVFETVLKRAETRLLNLHKKIESAPFLNNLNIKKFIFDNTINSQKQHNFNFK